MIDLYSLCEKKEHCDQVKKVPLRVTENLLVLYLYEILFSVNYFDSSTIILILVS